MLVALRGLMVQIRYLVLLLLLLVVAVVAPQLRLELLLRAVQVVAVGTQQIHPALREPQGKALRGEMEELQHLALAAVVVVQAQSAAMEILLPV